MTNETLYGVKLRYQDGREGFMSGRSEEEVFYSPSQELLVAYFREVPLGENVESRQIVPLNSQVDLSKARDITKTLASRDR